MFDCKNILFLTFLLNATPEVFSTVAETDNHGAKSLEGAKTKIIPESIKYEELNDFMHYKNDANKIFENEQDLKKVEKAIESVYNAESENPESLKIPETRVSELKGSEIEKSNLKILATEEIDEQTQKLKKFIVIYLQRRNNPNDDFGATSYTRNNYLYLWKKLVCAYASKVKPGADDYPTAYANYENIFYKYTLIVRENPPQKKQPHLNTKTIWIKEKVKTMNKIQEIKIFHTKLRLRKLDAAQKKKRNLARIEKKCESQ
uniref:Uncharacterized protein n=1 Tax=Ditylenchus dipsaci TaxID=166011 RepID=A0A915CKU9_9BILA